MSRRVIIDYRGGDEERAIDLYTKNIKACNDQGFNYLLLMLFVEKELQDCIQSRRASTSTELKGLCDDHRGKSCCSEGKFITKQYG